VPEENLAHPARVGLRQTQLESAEPLVPRVALAVPEGARKLRRSKCRLNR
jgi:hypothetical protein